MTYFPPLAPGQATMANSAPVVIASNQSILNTSDSTTQADIIALTAAVQALIDYTSILANYQNALPYARDTASQILVNLASGTLSFLGAIEWANSNVDAANYSTGAPNSMDAREVFRAQNNTQILIDRNARWVFS